MSPYCCSICSTPCDTDATHCECGGKIIATSIYLARRDAELDRIDQMWDAYHEMRAAEATYELGFMTKRQAGGVK